MYISEESKIAPTIVVLFSFPGFRFTDKVLHYLIFGASYTKKKLVFLSLPKKSFTYTYGLIFGASYTNKKAMLLTSKVPTLKLILVTLSRHKRNKFTIQRVRKLKNSINWDKF